MPVRRRDGDEPWRFWGRLTEGLATAGLDISGPHRAIAFGAVIAGTSLYGPLGALVSIPVVAAVIAVVETYGYRYALLE